MSKEMVCCVNYEDCGGFTDPESNLCGICAVQAEKFIASIQSEIGRKVMVMPIAELIPFVESLEAENERVKAEAKADIESISDDYRQRIETLCNTAWQKVYGKDSTNWDYPAQAIRHLVDYTGEQEREVKRLLAELESARAKARNKAVDELVKAVMRILIYDEGPMIGGTREDYEWKGRNPQVWKDARKALEPFIEPHPQQPGWYRLKEAEPVALPAADEKQKEVEEDDK